MENLKPLRVSVLTRAAAGRVTRAVVAAGGRPYAAVPRRFVKASGKEVAGFALIVEGLDVVDLSKALESVKDSKYVTFAAGSDNPALG